MNAPRPKAARPTYPKLLRRFSRHALLPLAVAILLAGCGQQQQQQAKAPPPPAVTVAKPVKKTVTDYDEYVGRFAAVNSVEVRARVSGYLDAVHFKDGQMVKKGDLLFTIDKRTFKNALDQAQATLTQAKSNLAYAQCKPSARPVAGEGKYHHPADLRAARPGRAQRAGLCQQRRGGGAAGQAQSGVHRAARAHRRPHRRAPGLARQPRHRRHLRQHHAARHHRLDRPDLFRVHFRRGVLSSLQAHGHGQRRHRQPA